MYKITIAYDGTHYSGWQIQSNALSIQALIQNALSIILRRPTHITASSRTDAGVHALAQVAHFTCEDTIDCCKTRQSLNALLPPDIRIMALDPVDPCFHARFSALSKIYHYYLDLRPVADPFQRLYAYRPYHPIDSALLREAAHYFIGTHDFTSFANTRSLLKTDNIRTIYRLEIAEEEQGICLIFEGNGFLYKMIRNIVGALLDVCAKKIAPCAIAHIMAARDRKVASPAAPAHGLFLIEVKYPLAYTIYAVSGMAANDVKCSPPIALHTET